MKVNELYLYLFLAVLFQVLVPIVSVVMPDLPKAKKHKINLNVLNFFISASV